METPQNPSSPRGFLPSLRARYVAITVGLALLPLVLLVCIVQQDLRERFERQHHERVSASVNLFAGNLTNLLSAALAQLRALAAMPAALELLKARTGIGVDPVDGSAAQIWKDRYSEILRAFAANDRSIQSIRLVGQDEQILLQEDFLNGVAVSADKLLKIDPGQDPGFTDAHKLPEGKVYVSQVRRRHHAELSSVNDSVDSGLVTIATPVYIDGHPGAVLIADLRTEDVLAGVGDLAKADHVVISDGRGNYLRRGETVARAPSRDASLFADWPGLDPRKLDMMQYSRSGGRELVAKLFDANASGPASFWVVGVIKDGDVVAAMLKETGGLVLQWALVLAVLAVSVALVMAEAMTKPLSVLAETARRIRSGDAGLRVPSDRGDEIGNVARSFNAMLDSLESSRQSLINARARDEAEARAKSEFLANLRQEIRTPLSKVLALLDLIAQSGLNQAQRHFSESARTSAQALSKVLSEILDMFQIEVRKLAVEYISFDLRRLVEECITSLSPHAQDKNLQLLCFVPADIPSQLTGDPVRVQQILMTLLRNAIGFTQRGEVSLTLRTHSEAGGRMIIRFEIKDTSAGISDSDRESLFLPFTRNAPLAAGKHPGAALALSVCRQLVGLMNGETGAETKAGKGNTYWFEIPLRKAEAPGPMPQAPPDLAGLRVLVVDENASERLIIDRYLTAWAIRPTSVDGPGAALLQLRQAAQDARPFDLVILAMELPAMDGVTLATTVQVEAGLPRPKFLLLNSGNPPDSQALTRAGIGLCLARPVEQSKLLESVAQMMGVQPPESQTERKETLLPLANRRVLLVEDNMVNQQIALYSLKPLGAEVVLANNGRLALDAMATQDFDLVLMDCQMPEMDGFEATRRIRDAQAHSGKVAIPIIAMTTEDLESERERCLAAGMNDSVTKPLQHDQLRALLERWLNKSAQDDRTSVEA